MNLERYRNQHDSILQMAESIEKLLTPEKLKEEADGIRSMLSALVGKLNVHLAMEDDVLYPVLLEHSKDEVNRAAKRLQDEAGDLKRIFQVFVDRWPSGEPVKTAPVAFACDVRALLTKLRDRIARENDDLFPLVES